MNTLWTPTNWNAEFDLLKEFLTESISEIEKDQKRVLMYNKNNKALMQTFITTGVLYVSTGNVKSFFKLATFEEWKSKPIWTTSEGKRVSFEELVKSVTDKF